MQNKRIVCVIPARLGSTRFPRKMLAPLGGKPLLQWAYEGAKKCGHFNEVVVAVDSQELMDAVHAFEGNAIFTDLNCKNGTERLVELYTSGKMQGDVWVNWQGDEPFIAPATIEQLLQTIHAPGQEIWTLKKEIDFEHARSENVVKVVSDRAGRALYFSRSMIPFDWHGKEKIYKHVGIYAYASTALEKIKTLSECPLEKAERLEQLRFLYNGLSIHVHETDQEIFGIDTREDLAKAELFLQSTLVT